MRHPKLYEGKSPMHKLYWFQYLLLDVLAFFLLIIYVVFKIIKFIVFKLIWLCFGRNEKLKKDWNIIGRLNYVQIHTRSNPNRWFMNQNRGTLRGHKSILKVQPDLLVFKKYILEKKSSFKLVTVHPFRLHFIWYIFNKG